MVISNVTRAALVKIWETPRSQLEASFAPVGMWWGDLDEVRFLERLYPLHDMPSTDDGFPDARADIIQHCVNNYDWDGFWVLRDDRFKLDEDATLLTLLAETIHPEVRSDADQCERIAQTYNDLLRRDGLELYVESRLSGLPVYAGRRYVPTATEIRNALAGVISVHVKAYNVAEFCQKIGLGPALDQYGDPMDSKASYVGRHALHADRSLLVKAAQATLAEFDDVDLRVIIEAAADGKGPGVKNPPKNLIFAANGPKPELVLRDAINNDIEITKNAEFCLVYMRPLADEGLSWQNLIDWWRDSQPEFAESDAEKALYQRLKSSLSDQSPGELLVLYTYCCLLKECGRDLPALIPQVYLHLDPRTRVSADTVLARQRMDFLILLPEGRRVVIEVDGKQHYSTSDGEPSPKLYGEMMAEDRRIRLAGYEVYRFGGAELLDAVAAVPMLRQFFVDLLTLHGIGIEVPAGESVN